MTAAGAHESIVTLAARHGVVVDRVRAFATEPADLEVNFHAPRAVAVTELLTTCLGLDPARVWELPLSTRLLLLVALSELTAPPIEIYFDCTCGEQAELEISARELAEFAESRVSVPLTVERDGMRIALRLPTGRDQLRWTVLAASGDDHDLARRVLSDLVVDGGELPAALVPVVDRVLAEADPLVELQLDTVCPACDADLATAVDLEAIGLARLRHLHRMLLEDVHVLAGAYHWSEQQIAALPAWRRNEYRALLGRSRA